MAHAHQTCLIAKKSARKMGALIFSLEIYHPLDDVIFLQIDK